MDPITLHQGQIIVIAFLGFLALVVAFMLGCSMTHDNYMKRETKRLARLTKKRI